MKNIYILLLIILATNIFAAPRGEISSRPCPYSCRTQSLDKEQCKDWRDGNTCFVEDLTKQPKQESPRARTSMPRVPSGSDLTNKWQNNDFDKDEMYYGRRNSPSNKNCNKNQYYARPGVYILNIKRTGGYFSSKVKVSGYIEGVCIEEAGLFEDGYKTSNFQIPTTNQFGRYEFQIVTDKDRVPEIRAYNILGDKDVQFVGAEGNYSDTDAYPRDPAMGRDRDTFDRSPFDWGKDR